MIVSTTENLVGLRITQTLGQVFGVVVRSRGVGGNVMAGLRSLGGGEIKEYTALVEDTRRHAIDRMVANATAMGADAVVMMRFDSGEIGQTMSEVVAYGTAVKVANRNEPGAQRRHRPRCAVDPVRAAAAVPPRSGRRFAGAACSSPAPARSCWGRRWCCRACSRGAIADRRRPRSRLGEDRRDLSRRGKRNMGAGLVSCRKR